MLSYLLECGACAGASVYDLSARYSGWRTLNECYMRKTNAHLARVQTLVEADAETTE